MRYGVRKSPCLFAGISNMVTHTRGRMSQVTIFFPHGFQYFNELMILTKAHFMIDVPCTFLVYNLSQMFSAFWPNLYALFQRKI